MAAALRRPGWYRGALGAILGGAFGFGLVVALRAISGLDVFQTEQTGYPQVVVPAITAPLGFLLGFGCFDYWLRWAAGAPTVPEDHSGHGAHSWRDYFRVNTDHKVIGIQYIVTTFFFFVAGGVMAMLMRAELAAPGRQFVDANTFNGLFSVHASLMIFLFIIPVFAGIANYVLPLMIGAPDMAFSLMAIVFLGFTVWAHHMFVSGMFPWLRVPMMITTMLIAVPTGIKIFSWLATLWRGVIHLRTPMLFALGFITMFTLGGISGVMLAVIPYDIHVSDTYFVV